MATQGLLDSFSTYVEEKLPQMFEDARIKVDPTFPSIVKTSERVESDTIGRGYIVRHRFRTSISGHIERAPLNQLNLSGGSTDNLKNTVAYGTPPGYPDPANMTHSGSIVRLLTLARHKGNFSIPTEIFQHGGLDPLILEDVAQDLKGLSIRRAQMEAVSFYAGNKHFGTVPASTTYSGSANQFLSFKPGSSRIRWFMKGMMVNVTTAANALVNVVSSVAVPLIVDNVDPLNGTITLSTAAGLNLGTAFDGADNLIQTDGNLIYPFAEDATSTSGMSLTHKLGHFGLEDWIKDTGNVLESTVQSRYQSSPVQFNLGDYPEFKSYVKDAGNAALDDTLLQEVFGKFIEAYDADIDTLITTRGVLHKFLEQPQTPAGTGFNAGPRQTWDRQGQALDFKAGFKEFPSYVYDGKEYDIMLSPYCQSGNLYGMKLGQGNLKRYVPKAVGGVGDIKGYGMGASSMGMDGEIRFIMPMGGLDGIFGLTRDTNGRVQAFLEAPFDQFSQIAPVDVRGIKISNLTESPTTIY